MEELTGKARLKDEKINAGAEMDSQHLISLFSIKAALSILFCLPRPLY